MRLMNLAAPFLYSGREVFLERLPAGVVLVLQGGCVHGKFCGAADEAGFKHEGQGTFEFDGFEVSGAGAFEGLGVGAVAGHAVVERCASGDEAFGFGVVFALDEAHEFVHEVAVEPGGGRCARRRSNVGGR